MIAKITASVDEEKISDLMNSLGLTSIEETIKNEMMWVEQSGLHVKDVIVVEQ